MSETDGAGHATEDALAAAAAMSTDEAIGLLTYCEIGRSPAIAMQALMARRSEVTDRLVAEIKLDAKRLDDLAQSAPDERHSYFLHTFAAYMLAHWSEPRTFGPLISYLAADTHAADDQLGDTVTEDLHAILARTYDGGGLGGLKAIVESNDANAFVRNACLKSLHTMVRLGKLPREDVVAYYAHVGETLRDEINEHWSDLLLITLAQMQEPSLRPIIQTWFAAGLTDDGYLTAADIDDVYAEPDSVIELDVLQGERFEGLIDYLSGWDWFNSDDPSAFLSGYDGDGEAEEREPIEPFVREGRKIGRNEPCPCGSGKKYKKCCLEGDAA
jgi:hypothetical protein